MDLYHVYSSFIFIKTFIIVRLFVEVSIFYLFYILYNILQLGMMVIAVGLSSYNIALFHLVNHAFYKALLFLGAGAVIHAVADNQDQHIFFYRSNIT